MWEVTVMVIPPCDSFDLSGLEEGGGIGVELDQKKQLTLVVKFNTDNRGFSWGRHCGSTPKLIFLKVPRFVKYKKEITIYPVHRSDIGTHSVLLKLFNVL